MAVSLGESGFGLMIQQPLKCCINGPVARQASRSPGRGVSRSARHLPERSWRGAADLGCRSLAFLDPLTLLAAERHVVRKFHIITGHGEDILSLDDEIRWLGAAPGGAIAVGWDGSLGRWSASDGSRRLWPGGTVPRAPVMATDGTRLALGVGTTIEVR